MPLADEEIATPVAVIGGGMAGCAACLALARQGVAAAWVAPPPEHEDKPGESLAAAASPLLARLGVAHLLADPAHRKAQVSYSAWGSPALLERHADGQPGGMGHILDRGRFEAGLRTEVLRHPGIMIVSGSLGGFERTASGWMLSTDDGRRIATRLIIDASGRRSVVGRGEGGFRRLDRLVAAYALLAQSDPGVDPTPATLMEAVDTGWWYATLLADRRLVVNYYSDPDLMPRHISGETGIWRALAERTTYISRWLESAGYELAFPPRLASAGTAWLETVAGSDWLAVGDAAASFDPLSAHGMTTALWTGIAGAQAAARALEGDESATTAYAARLRAGVDHYRRARPAIYGCETRFHDQPFWRRRRVLDEVQ